MAALLHAIRITLRRLSRDPTLASISVMAFALGIGLTVSMYSIAYGLLYRGLPVRDPDALRFLTRMDQTTGRYQRMSPFLDYLDWRERQTSFVDLAAYGNFSLNLADDTDQPERVSAAYVTPDLFPVLGVAPALGRGLEASEIGPGHDVVLISDALWRRRYGADPNILGHVVRGDGVAYTIIGVMPPRFGFPDRQSLWLPCPWDRGSLKRGQDQVWVVGRLRPGVSAPAAEAEMSSVVDALAQEYPDTNHPASVHAEPIGNLSFDSDDRTILGTMMASGFFVLLIGCSNVANLLMARATGRSKQLAIATALGASRRRLLGGLLLESAILAAVGGLLGVALAHLYLRWFGNTIARVGAPMWVRFGVDLPILLFTVGVSALAAALAGLMPAWRGAAVSVREVLQDEGRGASSLRTGRWSQGMVVTAITLAFPLLVGAGLMIRSLQAAGRGRAFETRGVLVARFVLPGRVYNTPDARKAFWDRLLEWANGAAGVSGATYADALPGVGTSRGRVGIDETVYLRNVDRPLARISSVRPGFFAIVGAEPTAGRVLNASDRDGPPVAVINRPFAERYFPNTDPVGRRVVTQELFGPVTRTVVGVVPDLDMGGDSEQTPEGLYVPVGPAQMGFGYLLMRVRGDAAAAAPGLRAEVRKLDPDLAVAGLDTLGGFISRQFWLIRILGTVFTVFGLSALFLSAVGLYGVMAHSVTRRTREMGIRRAMGAESADILGLVLLAGLQPVVVGLALGGGLALLASRYLVAALYRVRPRDPATFGAVVLVLLAVALVAILVPAARATHQDPVEALHWE